jgi:hypothetical protein
VGLTITRTVATHAISRRAVAPARHRHPHPDAVHHRPPLPRRVVDAARLHPVLVVAKKLSIPLLSL